MLSYVKLQNKPCILQSLTGLNIKEFEQLLVNFEQAWWNYLEYRITALRTRRSGRGRRSQLQDNRDKLLFILVYFRLYPTQEAQGFLFGIGQSQAHKWVHQLTPVLNQALGNEQELPERTPWQLDTLLKECPALKPIVNETEQRANYLTNKDRQKHDYSAKKKTVMVKDLVISQGEEKTISLSDIHEGKKHDKAISSSSSNHAELAELSMELEEPFTLVQQPIYLRLNLLIANGSL